MAWIFLLVAGLFEVAWASGLKYSEGFTKLWPSVFTIVTSVISFVLLAQAMKTLPVGTSYAVWTGIGVVGTAILGVVLFGDSTQPARIAGMALILCGVVILKLTT